MSTFRDEREPGRPELHERFADIYQALHDLPDWEDEEPLRLSAPLLVRAEGEPAMLAAQTRRCFEGLLESEDVQRMFDRSEVFVMAAVLVGHGDEALPYLRELHRVWSMFRDLSLRYGAHNELLGILMLRCTLGGEPIQREHIQRIREIYLELRGHHWFLTGPEDYCACAMLAARPRTPAQIGQRAEDIYQALRRGTKLGWGERLHTVANLLSLGDLSPEQIVGRYVGISEGLRRSALSHGADFAEGLALMCFMATSTETLVSTLLSLDEGIGHALAERGLEGGGVSTVCSLVFVETVGSTLGPIAETLALADMRATVAARRSSDVSMGP